MGDLTLEHMTNAASDTCRSGQGDASNVNLPPVSSDVQSTEEDRFPVSDIIRGYYVVTTPFPAITKPPCAGQVDGHMKVLATTCVTCIIHAAKKASYTLCLTTGNNIVSQTI